MEPITLTYTPIKDDLVIPLRSQFMRRPLLVIQFAISGLLALFMLSLSAMGCISALLTRSGGDEPGMGIVSLVFPLFCAAFFSIVPAMYLFVIPAQRTRLFKKDERYRADNTWTLDDDHIIMATRFEEHKFDWSNFPQVREIKNYYLLMSGATKAAMFVLPKRAFTSPEQEQAFRELVERKVGPIK
jgi:hypothetical protein